MAATHGVDGEVGAVLEHILVREFLNSLRRLLAMLSVADIYNGSLVSASTSGADSHLRFTQVA